MLHMYLRVRTEGLIDIESQNLYTKVEGREQKEKPQMTQICDKDDCDKKNNKKKTMSFCVMFEILLPDCCISGRAVKGFGFFFFLNHLF